MNDVGRAVASALAEAEATETVKQIDAGVEGNGILATKATKRPKDLPQWSLPRPKVYTDGIKTFLPVLFFVRRACIGGVGGGDVHVAVAVPRLET